MTFSNKKPCHFLYPAAGLCGNVVVRDIGIPEAAVLASSPYIWETADADAAALLRPRPQNSHKGTFGSVLAVAGSAFYRGAALLAAEGALRTGAGIVTLASVEPVVSAAVTRLPECCLCPCKEGAQGGIAPENVPLLRRQKATVLLLGPGLGSTAQSAARAAETRTLVQQLLPGFAGAAVLDADGLNAAAQLLAEGKTNRIVCTSGDQIVNVDIDEGLAMTKTLNPEEFEVMTVMTGR